VYELRFTRRHDYASRVEGIFVPVVPIRGNETIELTASIDTGASFCLFSREYARALNINIETGEPRTFSTANSKLEAFGHVVIIRVLGIDAEALVFFFADENINKNVLGRRGWLDRLRFGLLEYEQKLFVSVYDGE
jgi:hypothetical protein